MKDQAKTKQALILELASLKERITELEQFESERKQATKKLHEIERRLYKVYEHSVDVIYTLDRDFRVTSISNSVERHLGYRAEEIVGRSFIDLNLVAPESLETAVKDALRALAGDTVPTSEYVLIRKDGSRVVGEVSGSPLLEDGKIIGLISVARDATERKCVEEELRALSAYNRSLIEASLDPLVTIGADGKITDVNAATEAATGYTRVELIGTEFSNYFTDPEQARAGYQEVFRLGSVHDHPLELRHRAGHVTSVLYNASVYRDAKGQVAGVFAAARNITERKRAEERIRASLREKEILIREVHHRVKNNMQVISGLLELQAWSSGNPELVEVLNESQSRIRSMAMVHEKLYDSEDFARIDLAGYVRALSWELFQLYKINPGRIDLIIQADGDVYVNINNSIPCGLILNELISNVLKHAFPADRQGELQIIIREVKDTEIEIVVRDNGVGLPDVADIRNPQTVGLYLVNGLVTHQLDGQLEVKRDKGTEFRIKFPL